MRKTKNILISEMYACVVISLMTVMLYETETLLPGALADDKNTEFLAVSLMELVTICMIPLSLRLFKFKRISRSLKSRPEQGLKIWGSLRMMMICLPMMVNTLLYYVFMNVAFGYMGIIGLICLLFIYPDTSRCVSETSDAK